MSYDLSVYIMLSNFNVTERPNNEIKGTGKRKEVNVKIERKKREVENKNCLLSRFTSMKLFSKM